MDPRGLNTGRVQNNYNQSSSFQIPQISTYDNTWSNVVPNGIVGAGNDVIGAANQVLNEAQYLWNDPVGYLESSFVDTPVAIGKGVVNAVNDFVDYTIHTPVSVQISDAIDTYTSPEFWSNAVTTSIEMVFGGGVAKQFTKTAATTSTIASSQTDDAFKIIDDFFEGNQPKVITNKSGDKILMTDDRKIRFDFKNSHKDKPHVHFEEKINDKWKDAFDKHRVYPKE